MSIVLLVGAVVQLYLGAQLRHTLPDTRPVGFLGMVHLHLTMAGLLTVWIVAMSGLVRTAAYRSASGLRGPANALLFLVFFQLALGLGTWIVNYALPWSDWSPILARYAISAKGYWESLVVTGHQATGSLLIALAVWMVCRTARRQVPLEEIRQSYRMAAGSQAEEILRKSV